MTMSNSNSQNSNNKKKRKISTGNPWVDLGVTVVTAIGGAAAGEVVHRVKEVRTRKKAKDLAVKTNNEEGSEN